jgi:aminoglycoside 3-N-acetyltransferase I
MSIPQLTMRIRAATIEDAGTLATLNIAVQSLHAQLVPALFKPPGADTYNAETMGRLVAQRDTIVLLAVIGDVPVGYAYAEVRRRPETPCARASSEIFLHHISVEDACRRMGVGSALLEAVGAAGRALGIERLATEVWHANGPATAFFQARGLVPYTQKLARGGWGVAPTTGR